jgi:hypothetical protein
MPSNIPREVLTPSLKPKTIFLMCYFLLCEVQRDNFVLYPMYFLLIVLLIFNKFIKLISILIEKLENLTFIHTYKHTNIDGYQRREL